MSIYKNTLQEERQFDEKTTFRFNLSGSGKIHNWGLETQRVELWFFEIEASELYVRYDIQPAEYDKLGQYVFHASRGKLNGKRGSLGKLQEQAVMELWPILNSLMERELKKMGWEWCGFSAQHHNNSLYRKPEIPENTPPFLNGEIVKFDNLYGSDYIKRGHIYGRVEGQHYYEQVDGKWVVDLQKMEMNGLGNMVPVGTKTQGVKIYMVPAWAVKPLDRGEVGNLNVGQPFKLLK